MLAGLGTAILAGVAAVVLWYLLLPTPIPPPSPPAHAPSPPAQPPAKPAKSAASPPPPPADHPPATGGIASDPAMGSRFAGATASAIRIWNNYAFAVDLYWADFDSKLSFLQRIEPGDDTPPIKAMPGHAFVSKRASDKANVLSVVRVGQNPELIYPLQELSEEDQKYWKETGKRWLNIRPKEAPKWAVLPAKEVGEEKSAQAGTYWRRIGQAIDSTDEDLDAMKLEEIADRTLTIRTISTDPKVFEIDDFFTEDETKHFIASAKTMLAQHEVHHPTNTGKEDTKSVWLEFQDTDIIGFTAKRAFDVLGIPAKSRLRTISEDWFVTRYSSLKSPVMRCDWFSPLNRAAAPSVLVKTGGYNRFVSVFVFLNDEGGPIAFPYRNRYLANAGLCTDPRVLKVTPKRGKAVVLYNMLEDGNLDEKAVYAHCPDPGEELKFQWIATLRIWDPSAAA